MAVVFPDSACIVNCFFKIKSLIKQLANWEINIHIYRHTERESICLCTYSQNQKQHTVLKNPKTRNLLRKKLRKETSFYLPHRITLKITQE